MAIKIDLLPGYVKLKKDLRNSITGCIVATGLVAGILLMVLQQRKLDLETAETDRLALDAVVERVATAKKAKETANAASAPLLTAVSFMANTTKTGPQRAALLHLVRQSIDEDTIVSSIDISDGQKVIIKATVRDPDQYARFLLNLRRASDKQGGTLFKELPVASGPKGFANGAVLFKQPKGDGTGQAVVINYPVEVTAEGTLLNPVLIPPDPVGGPAPGAAPGTGQTFPGAPAMRRP